MKLLFIRHADPDYEHDTITEKGKIEAGLLANIVGSFGIDDVYQSPLGRAQDTARYCLDVLGKDAVTLDWLREFPAEFDAGKSESARMAYANELKKDPESGGYQKRIVWDILPSYFANHPELFDVNSWRESEIVKASDMLPKYDYVISSFDRFLEDNGYRREGLIYRAEQGNDKVIALFCHFGITAVLLSRLWNVSPFVTMQFLATAPTSVTEVVTEERQKGFVSFRTLRVGDITHLNIGGEKPSFSGRFCEKFENEHERH